MSKPASRIAERMKANHIIFQHRAADFWLARGAVLSIAALQLSVINELTFGPRWLAPGIELALLIPLSAATAWSQAKARGATEEHHWASIGRHRLAIRRTALALTGIISLVNCGSLFLLVRALLQGHAGTGPTLLVDALNIWVTNVIIFALWFWNTDRAGPATSGLSDRVSVDFLFPQMTFADREARNWVPGFIDYVFLSFTNATAFSPTDTLPLTARGKLLMMAEAMISLLTVALVAARAVNILA
jgi:hypothetical protein